MVVAYGNQRVPSEISAYTQQADFITSFEYLVDDRSCTGPLNGNFFIEPVLEANVILFPRGDDRELIDLYTSDGHEATIRINGDATAFETGYIENGEDLVLYVNKERLRISRAEETRTQN